MWKKRVFGGLFLVACLMMMAKSQAWQNKGNPDKGTMPGQGEKIPTWASSEACQSSLPSPKGTPDELDAVSNLLARLVKIKKQRAELDKEEQGIVERIKGQLNDERQKIDAAEQELRMLAPHAFNEQIEQTSAVAYGPKRVAVGSLSQVCAKLQDGLNEAGIMVQTNRVGSDLRLAGISKTQTVFCLHLSARKDADGNKTVVRMQWDRGGDEELWQLILKILTNQPTPNANDSSGASLAIPSGNRPTRTAGAPRCTHVTIGP